MIVMVIIMIKSNYHFISTFCRQFGLYLIKQKTINNHSNGNIVEDYFQKIIEEERFLLFIHTIKYLTDNCCGFLCSVS